MLEVILMVKPFHTPVYQPMSDTENIMSEYDQYLKSLDKEYGTQFSVRELERTGEKKMEGTINEKKDTKSIEYKGYSIDYNIYGKGEYTVQTWDGEDNWFTSEEEAKSFIDGLDESKETEDHFDDKATDLEPEDPGYDEDEVLVEEADDEPYTTSDLADATIDLLNSDSMNWDNGVYEKREEALENVGDFLDRHNISDTSEGLSEDDWSKIVEDGEYKYLKDFMIRNPQYAEKIFDVVAAAYGFYNYRDYKSYTDWVDDSENLDYDDLNEATNPGAIANTPGTHVLLDLDEDEFEDLDDL